MAPAFGQSLSDRALADSTALAQSAGSDLQASCIQSLEVHGLKAFGYSTNDSNE